MHCSMIFCTVKAQKIQSNLSNKGRGGNEQKSNEQKLLEMAVMTVKNDHRSIFSNLSNWKEEA